MTFASGCGCGLVGDVCVATLAGVGVVVGVAACGGGSLAATTGCGEGVG